MLDIAAVDVHCRYKREVDEWEQVSKAMKLGAEQTRRLDASCTWG